jgi:hypothetical protein
MGNVQLSLEFTVDMFLRAGILELTKKEYDHMSSNSKS